MEKQEVRVWVDGSFSILKGYPIYGGGAVAYVGKSKNPIECKFADHNTNWARIRNVAGELLATMGILTQLTPFKDSISRIVVFYDYDGIAKWATGEWKTNKDCTKAYSLFMQDKKKDFQIDFVHVKAHTGDYNNERADRLAKEAVKEHADTL